MEDKPIQLVLEDESHIEQPESGGLRKDAILIVRKAVRPDFDTAQLPQLLHDLLLHVFKPLFSRKQHPKLTSTGRKNLVESAIPQNLTGFNDDNPFDAANRPLWKNGWTSALLQWLICCYSTFTDLDLRRKTLEAHFHYLIPPLLQQIDDIEVDYKAAGCRALHVLCDQLSSVNSAMLKKSGLMDVFVEALKTDFAMIPTLTPEDESLILYSAMYPAYRSLVRARLRSVQSKPKEGVSAASALGMERQRIAEEDRRVSYLTLLYRHQTLYSLAHLSTSGGGSTIAPELSTFFISQIAWLATDMGLAFVVHLQDTLPMLRRVMCDPFAPGHVQMLFECTKTMQTIVTVCWPRVKERWWGECLRGAIGCWGNVSDEVKEADHGKKLEHLQRVQEELKVLVCLLEDVVGDEYRKARQELIVEDPEVGHLFEEI